VIALLASLFLHAPPATLLVSTPRGDTRVPLSLERGSAAVAAPLLADPLGLVITLEGDSAVLRLGAATFVLRPGTPFARADSLLCPLLAESYVVRDTLFLPLAFLADCVPRALAPRYTWVPAETRLIEAAPVAAAIVVPPPAPVAAAAVNPLTGLRLRHVVAVDAGHGGVDPGNPGVFFPHGITEKDITLDIARLLRAELMRRGIAVVMTRAADTLIDLQDRPGYCTDACDLFVSIHVNSMPVGRNQSRADGVETYYLQEAKTEDQRRVAKMENDAVRFQADVSTTAGSPLAWILKDMQMNEYLRESANLAGIVQGDVAKIHPGDNRGVQQAPFLVLSAARRPAILVETGFSTNRDDGAFLTSKLGQHKIASAIADGIVEYLRGFERKLAVAGGGGPPR
jgi:N-acetylmuramoyl-L-alanine amidase